MSETIRIDIPDYHASWLSESMFFEEWDPETNMQVLHDFASRLGRSLVWDAKSRRVVMKKFINASDFLRRKQCQRSAMTSMR